MMHWTYLIQLDSESVSFLDLSISHVTMTVLVITVSYFAFRRQFWIAQNIFILIGICIFDVKDVAYGIELQTQDNEVPE